jgi:hypothetical protein
MQRAHCKWCAAEGKSSAHQPGQFALKKRFRGAFLLAVVAFILYDELLLY